MSGHADMGEVLTCIAVAVALYALTFGPFLFFMHRVWEPLDREPQDEPPPTIPPRPTWQPFADEGLPPAGRHRMTPRKDPVR